MQALLSDWNLQWVHLSLQMHPAQSLQLTCLQLGCFVTPFSVGLAL